MSMSQSMLQLLLGSDAAVRRLLRYGAVGLALYAVSLSQLWFQAAAGSAPLRAMSLFAIILLGLTMLLMVRIDARRFPAQEEFVHFVLAATMLVAVG